MLQYRVRKFKLHFIIAITILFFPFIAKSEDFFLEPIIQGYNISELILTIKEEQNYFINIEQLAEILQFKLNNRKEIEGVFLGKDFRIDTKALNKQDYRVIDGKYYFSIGYYETIFPIKIRIDIFDMQLIITSNQELPITKRLISEKRRQNYTPLPEPDTFKNYQFDNRLISSPVVDFTYRNSQSISDYNGDNQKRYNSDYYQIDSSMLLGGFDTYASIFGDSDTKSYNPRTRITVGRTFLDEPKNALNLTTFEAGDVSGFNSTLFNNSANGRGMYASSFKDLVLSADKTIDINGPLSDGWNVELYLNDQLIGFRQAGINGRYQFSNIPVNYGQNKFKLVFYGPYGEIQTEERDYYSGTSPVKSGEFGYNINAYQKDRFLFEENEPFVNPSNKATLDFTGYYGLNDYVTLISGLTQTANIVDDETQNFGTTGVQFVFSGASFQYNTLYGFENQTTGHHFDVQGDVGFGNIFARYDYYGDLQAPIAFYNNEYLKEVGEVRLTGFMPWFNLPYYLSYLENVALSGDKTKEIHSRISPNFMRYYNFTLENIWTENKYGNYDDIILLLQAQYDKLGIHSQVKYRLSPDAYIYSFGQQVDYRWTKKTFFQANWDHDCRSQYSDQSDLDTISISAGHLFPIGGLTLSLSADTDNNATIALTYNMSFGKVPDRAKVFTSAQASMTERASLYAKAVDENNNPIKDTKLVVTGLQDPVITDKNGEALITDIEPYQKTILSIDTKSVEDVALIPEFESKKLVLRPGTVLPITIQFAHKGGFEGFISGANNLDRYKISLINSKGEKISSKTPEADGSFIFDGINYGKYKALVTDDKNQQVKEIDINLNQAFYSMEKPIEV